jgi:hypothetical protein
MSDNIRAGHPDARPSGEVMEPVTPIDTRESMTDEELFAAVRQAIADPGSVLPSQPGETLSTWAARAVTAVVDDEALARMADTLLQQTTIRSVDFRNGMSMELKPARALAANFVGMARAMLSDAPNYSETVVEFPPDDSSVSMELKMARQPERFTLTVQRVGKLTPHQARQAAETRAAEAQSKINKLAHGLAEILGIALDETANPGPALERIVAIVGDLQRPVPDEPSRGGKS